MGPNERVAVIADSRQNGKPVLMQEHVEAAMRQYALDGIVTRPIEGLPPEALPKMSSFVAGSYDANGRPPNRKERREEARRLARGNK